MGVASGEGACPLPSQLHIFQLVYFRFVFIFTYLVCDLRNNTLYPWVWVKCGPADQRTGKLRTKLEDRVRILPTCVASCHHPLA